MFELYSFTDDRKELFTALIKAQASMGAAALLVALILFASKVALPPYLLPGDFLHVFMAFGLMLLRRKASLVGV